VYVGSTFICIADWYHLLTRNFLQRRDVLDRKGEEPGLINRLLEDAQKWTEFRSYVRDQVDAARKFGVGYSHRYQEEIALRELQAIVNEYEREINDEIDLLDKSSQSLIEIVST
jgi:hypothetical protein